MPARVGFRVIYPADELGPELHGVAVPEGAEAMAVMQDGRVVPALWPSGLHDPRAWWDEGAQRWRIAGFG